MRFDPQAVRDAVAAHRSEAQQLLCDLVAIPSPPGQEAAVLARAEQAFAPLADIRRVPMTDALKQDPEYSDSMPDLDYEGRYNLRLSLRRPSPSWRAPKGPAGKSLLLNAHLDAVPPSQGQESPFRPTLRDGAVFGRGACDAKGQAATLYLAMAALKDLGVPLGGDLVAHLVVEEELGGNGTLAMVRAGEKADACIVLEPTDLKILIRQRGAVWFRVNLRGKPGHSGQAVVTRNAIDMAVRVIDILRAYHKQLLDASRSEPLFDKFPNPMPLTIGQLHAGNWPSIAPGEAMLEGVMGFLPNRTAAAVMQEITARIAHEGGELIAGNFDTHFTYRHDASVLAEDHPLVLALQAAGRGQGCNLSVDAMTASCDAVFYNHVLGIPTLVFGGGSLSVAHGNNEHMPLGDLAAAAEILTNLALAWCGA